MVLRLTIFFFLIFSFKIYSQELKLIATDANEMNFYLSNSDKYHNKLFIGNDMFRFLKQENLNEIINIYYDFLEEEKLISAKSFEKINDFTICIPLKIEDIEDVTFISSKWEKKYSKIAVDLIYNLFNSLIETDNVKYENSIEPVLYQMFLNEFRNRYSEHAKSSETTFAFTTKNNSFEIESHRSFFQRKYNIEKLLYTEIALVKSNKDSIVLAIPIVSKLSKPFNILSLKILEQLENDYVEILYGVNQSFLVVKNPYDLNLSEALNINEEKFNVLHSKVKDQDFKYSDINNLFFYTIDDLKILNNSNLNFEYSDFQDFLNKLKNLNKIIAVNQDIVKQNEINLEPSNQSIFDKVFKMKSNSIEFEHSKDEKLISQLYLFMHFNENLNININGYALEEEYSVINSSKIKNLINKDKSLKTDYKLSKKTSLALLRSTSIFQSLVDLGIEKDRIRCNGLISDEKIQGIKISIQK